MNDESQKSKEASAEDQPSGAPPAQAASNRAGRTAERRAAIVDAAFDEFVARGFTATRIDDIAKRAGVAKGTIYLHFKDKEALFEELIRTAIVPLVNRLAAGPPPVGGGLCMRPISGTIAVRISSSNIDSLSLKCR